MPPSDPVDSDHAAPDPGNDPLDRIEGIIGQHVEGAVRGLRESLREQLEGGHQEMLRRFDEVALDLPDTFLNRAHLAPVEQQAAEGGRAAALDDLLAGLRGIDHAGTQAEILDALVAAGAHFAGRSLLLLTRAEGAEGWGGSGWGDADPAGLTLGYDAGTPWARLAEGRGVVSLRSGDCAGLCSRLESPIPAAGVLVPLVLRDHVAAALYADRESAGDRLEVAALQALTFAAAQAVETLPFRDREATPTLRTADDDAESLPLWGADVVAAATAAAGAEPEAEEAADLAVAATEEPAEEPAWEPADEPAWEAAEEEPGDAGAEEAEESAEPAGEGAAWELADVTVEEVTVEDVAVDSDDGADDATPAEEPGEGTGAVLAQIGELEEIGELDLDEIGGETPFLDTAAEPTGAAEAEEPGEAEAGGEGWSAGAGTTEVETAEEPEAGGETDELEAMDTADTADQPEAAETPASADTRKLFRVPAEPEDDGEPADDESTGAGFAAVAEPPELPEPPAPSPPDDEDLRATRMIERPSFATTPPAPPPEHNADDTMAGVQVRPPADLDGPGWAFARSEEAAGSDEEAMHEEARRLARLLVSEIRLYNEEQVDEGRRNRDIYERVKDDIDRARRLYEERVDPSVSESTDYFYQELVRILANGDAGALGL